MGAVVLNARARVPLLVAALAVTMPVLAQTSAPVPDVDTASQRYIEWALADSEVLYDTSITWRNDAQWSTRFILEPRLASAMYVGLGLPDKLVLLFERVIGAYGSMDSARRAAGAILYSKRNRELSVREQADVVSLQQRETAFRDSLAQAMILLDRQLTPIQSERFSQWLREDYYIGGVVCAKVEQAFYADPVHFGTGAHAAPDSLESAWRLLETAPVFQELISRRASEVLALLPVSGRLPSTDSSALLDAIIGYRHRFYRIRAELLVARETFIRLSPLKEGLGEEVLDAYEQELVARIRLLRDATLDTLARMLGVQVNALEGMCIP